MWQRKWASVVKIAKTVFPSSGLESDNLGVEFEKLLLFGAEGSFWLKRKAGSCWGMPPSGGYRGMRKPIKKPPVCSHWGRGSAVWAYSTSTGALVIVDIDLHDPFFEFVFDLQHVLILLPVLLPGVEIVHLV